MGPERLPLLLLPGLDGTGKLFARFAAELPGNIEPTVIPLPAEPRPGLERLASAMRERLPIGRPYALLAESFSGPVAIRLAAEQPPDLVALVHAFREAVRETAPAVLAARVSTALDADEARALAACRVPVLYVGGARDRLLRPGIPAELKHLRPAMELRILDAPHLVLQREPVESARVVSGFLARAGAGRGATGVGGLGIGSLEELRCRRSD